MKIDVRDLKEGSNPFHFTIGVEKLDAFVKEADELYAARGADCTVDVDIFKVEDVLTARGTIRAPYGFTCGRCLAERDRSLEIRLNWTLLSRQKQASDDLSTEEELEVTSDDLDVTFYEGEEIDLEDLTREAIVLELDPAPQCDPEPCDGPALAALQKHQQQQQQETDPRWAQLEALRGRLTKN